MNKLGVAVMIALAVAGGALVSTTLFDQPAKASAGARIDVSQLRISVKNLPAAHYDDYSVVFN